MLNQKQAPCVYVLSLPGGGMHGIMSIVGLMKLSDILETPPAKSFHLKIACSTGAIICAGISIEDPSRPSGAAVSLREDNEYTMSVLADNPSAGGEPLASPEEALAGYLQQGLQIFPQKNLRQAKLLAASIYDFIKMSNDPDRENTLIIKEAKVACALLSQYLPVEERQTLEDIKKIISKNLFARSDKKNLLRTLSRLEKLYPDYEDVRVLKSLVQRREECGRLKASFAQVSHKFFLKPVYEKYMRDAMYDPHIARKIFRETYGESRLKHMLGSVVIFAHNRSQRKAELFYKFNNDIFDTRADVDAEISHPQAQLWDVVLAAIANMFAFPRHTMQSGQVYRDHATAFSITYPVLKLRNMIPKGTDIKIVEFGTGWRDPKETSYAPLAELAFHGIDENSDHIRTLTMESIKEIVSPDNIHIFNPRLTPRTLEEFAKFPKDNFMDASEEQTRKLVNLAEAYYNSEDVDRRLKSVAADMAENMYLLGQIDEEKYTRILERCDSGDRCLDRDNVQKLTEEARSGKIVGSLRRFFGLDIVGHKEQESHPPQLKKSDLVP